MHRGVLEGRKAFGTVMTALLMGTSFAFGETPNIAGATLFLRYLPMLPTRVLLVTSIYDVSPMTTPMDKVDKSFIEKPHRWDIALISDFMSASSPKRRFAVTEL